MRILVVRMFSRTVKRTMRAAMSVIDVISHFLGRFWKALNLLNQTPTRARVTNSQLSFLSTQQYYVSENTWSMFRSSTRWRIFDLAVIG
jgi:hypothetical protein